MINDILPLDEAQFGSTGAHYWQVAANASGQGTGANYVPAFRAGEPVIKLLGTGTTDANAQPWGTIATGTNAKPVVATDFMAGIAISGQGGGCSTETATAAGYVYVTPLVPNVIYLMSPLVAATWNTQAKYNALVGSRVLINMDNGVPPTFTILASDSSTSGLVVEWIDITKYPGKVAFSFRMGLNYLT